MGKNWGHRTTGRRGRQMREKPPKRTIKLIIAGSRTIRDMAPVRYALAISPFDVRYIKEIVSGGASGVDRLGETIAHDNDIPVIEFKPEWERGMYAGMERNIEMAKYADALLAVWDGTSNGTFHMIHEMRARNKPVYVLTVYFQEYHATKRTRKRT